MKSLTSIRSMSLVPGIIISILIGGCVQAGPSEGSPPAALAGAHHDHSSQRGGMVLMNGDVHFEIVPGSGGHHAVHFSDAHRRPLPASAIQEATLAVLRDGEPPEELGLRPQPDGTWTAAGRPIGAKDATLRFSYLQRGEEAYSIDLPVTAP